MIKVSVIGLGQMGVNHLINLTKIKKVNLIKIYDKIRKKELEKKFKTKFVNNVNEVLDESNAIIIASPTSTHLKYFLKCSKKIKNIFIEKPLVTNINDFKKIFNIVKKKNINLKVGYIERFNPTIQTLKKILKGKKIFSLDFVRTNNRKNIIKDTSIIFDVMTHDIDLALYFSGNINSISANGFKEMKKIKFATCTLQHKNHSITRIYSNSESIKKERILNITTDNEYISANLLTREITITKKIKSSNSNKLNLKSNYSEKKIYVSNKNALRDELENFVNSCGKKPQYSELKALYTNTLICKKIERQILKK